MTRQSRAPMDPSSDVEIVKPAKKKSKKASSNSSKSKAEASNVASATSFFAPRPKLKQTSSSKESPIVLTDSPVKTRPTTLAEYDAIRKEGRKRKAAQMQGYEPSWPTRESMHVIGMQDAKQTFGPVDCSVSKAAGIVPRPPRKRARIDSGYKEKSEAVHQIVQTCPPAASTSSVQVDTSAQTMESSHPLTQRIRQDKHALDAHENREMWTVKYAPRSADQVLGSTSRASAQTLRNWVQELALRRPSSDPSVEKRSVTRRIDPSKKKRKRYDSDDELDDFIVDDDSDDDLRPAPDTDDLSQPLLPPSQFDNLTNLILLTGPAGTGKTSSVYAVAEELGFEVFEVSPGHGKRSYKDLLTAVGGVGSNHLVWTSGKAGPMGSVSSPKGKKPLSSFFGSKSDVKGKGKEKEGKANGLDALFGSKSKGKGKAKDSEQEKTEQPEVAPKEVSQSLILLEEVDILFQDDKSYTSFWDGVVQIVANSMRPVILTCNDPKQIPYDRLALQTTLYFAAPEENEVLPYLQAVSSSKDRQLPEDLLRSIYQTQLYRIPAQHPPSGIGFHPPASLVFQGPVSADLRRSLTTLQFWDGPPKPTSTTATSNDKSISSDLKRHLNLTECASFSDAFVGRKAATYRLDFDGDAAPPESQRELEHAYLDIQAADVGQNDLPEYLLDEAMHGEVLSLAEREFGHATWTSQEDDQLVQDRAALLCKMEIITNACLPYEAPILPCEATMADYCPYIVQIVLADDQAQSAFDAAMTEAKAGNSSPPPLPRPINAGTRRSRRLNGEFSGEYERHLPGLPSEVLEIVRSVRMR